MEEFRVPVWLMQPIPYWGEKLEGDWIWEPKYDGWRMQAIRFPDGHVELWGRRLEKKPNWTEKLGEIAIKVKDLVPPGTVLDCELCSDRGRDFVVSLFSRNPRAKPLVYVFDVIYFDGKFVGEKALSERKEIILELKFVPPFYPVRGEKVINIKEHLETSVQNGYEGIVIKKLNSPYEVGKDGPIATVNWRKIKKLLFWEEN